MHFHINSRLRVLLGSTALAATVCFWNSAGLSLPSQQPSANEGVRDLKKIFLLVTDYRLRHIGAYPKNMADLLSDLSKKTVTLDDYRDQANELTNTDAQLADDPFVRKHYNNLVVYGIYGTRPDGSIVGAPKPAGDRDVLASTFIYVHLHPQLIDGKAIMNARGNYLVLWDDGDVEAVPYDDVLYVIEGDKSRVAFYNQAGVSAANTASYAEFWTTGQKREGGSTATIPSSPLYPPDGKPVPQGKKVPIPDNGGPESLVALSRLLSFPSRYGIEREELWKSFDAARDQFTLADVQAGAAKLKLPLELKALSLDELHKLNTPAIFLTSDDKRLVVLSQLDDKQAIVIDRGLTRIVPRDLLAVRYGGQALVAASALAPAALAPQVLADDAVRQLSLTSPEQVVTQTVKISNSGGSLLTLQIERPIPGCEKAKLSASAIAPGQNATLSLTLRWRSVLKSPTQNVLVFLATNDPRRPRLPIGFKLALPAPP